MRKKKITRDELELGLIRGLVRMRRAGLEDGLHEWCKKNVSKIAKMLYFSEDNNKQCLIGSSRKYES